MGGDYSQPKPESEASVLQAYSKYLPTLTPEVAAQIPGIAQKQLEAAQQTQGGYNQLNLDQLNKYALPEAQVGQNVARSNALAGAETNLAQLQGSGGEAARAAADVNRATNPDYYTAQDAASKGAAQAIGAINLNGLSPGEEAAIERSTNQNNIGTGNLGVLNPTNTISNAVNFGGAFNSKVGLMNNAVNSASTAANSASNNGGFNGVNVALGQPNVSTAGNFGTNAFSPASSTTSAGSAGNAFNFAGGLMNNMNSANNSLIGANAQTGAAQIGANSPAAYLGAVCCFIFLEAYHGNIPKHVRHGRDKYYALNHDIATGYRRMAKWLVPLMQRSSIIRKLTWHLMIFPITSHLGYSHRRTGWIKYRKTTHFWLKFWAWLGKGKNESSYAMEWNYGKRERTA